MYIPLSPGGRLRKQLPRGPFDGVFFKLFGLGNEYWTFFSLWGYGLFEIWKCFIPGGRLLCSLLRGPFVFNLGFIGVMKGVWGFKNTGDDRPF